MLDEFDIACARAHGRAGGKIGGLSKSKAKRKAASDNGKLGGRTPTRPLVARLLGKRIAPEQRKYIAQAYGQLFQGEQRALERFFDVADVLGEEPLHPDLWRTRTRRIPKDIRYIIKKFKLAANHFLKPVPAPKDYIVEHPQRSEVEQDVWERMHPDSNIPCPPHTVRVYFKRLPDFAHVEFLYKRNPNLTAKTIMGAFGGRWTQPRAEAALAWLKATAERERTGK